MTFHSFSRSDDCFLCRVCSSRFLWEGWVIFVTCVKKTNYVLKSIAQALANTVYWELTW